MVHQEGMARLTQGASEMEKVFNQIAFAAGYNAALNGKMRAPALCAVYLDLIKDEPVGGNGVRFANSWLAGYEMQVNEECERILAA